MTTRQIPLKEPGEPCKNTAEGQRQRLADLIGKLLARQWLMLQSERPATKSPPIPKDH